jgi:hypothetical protein
MKWGLTVADKPFDQRIEEADAVKAIIDHRGYKTLFNYYSLIKEQAFKDLIDETLPSSNLELRQKLYNQICDWLKIPEIIIATGNQAVEEMKVEEKKPETFIKRAIPFLSRRG